MGSRHHERRIRKSIVSDHVTAEVLGIARWRFDARPRETLQMARRTHGEPVRGCSPSLRPIAIERCDLADLLFRGIRSSTSLEQLAIRGAWG